jgi:hypothetical protein
MPAKNHFHQVWQYKLTSMAITFQEQLRAFHSDPKSLIYQISFPDTPETLGVPITQLLAPDEPIFPLIDTDCEETDDTMPSMPEWIKENTHATIQMDGRCLPGTLCATDKGWTFQQRTASGRVTYRLDLADLPVTWKERPTKGTLELGWQDTPKAFHVSASSLKLGTPASL